MNNLSNFEIGTVIAVLIAVLTGGLWLGALTTKVEFLHEDYGAVKEEREKTIHEIQSQKEIILAEIQKAKQPAMNGAQIKAFETQLIKVETRLTQVQQTLDTLQIAEEREKTINEIQSQKKIILAEIQKAKQPALNGSQIKAFETQLIKVETRITQVQQRLDTLQIADEREKTINEIQSQKEIILAEIQKAKQPALNGAQIKAFETQLIKVETRITQVQQRLDTLQIAEEREKTINEIQSQKEIILAEIQKAKQPALNGAQIKAFETQLIKVETRLTQVQQTLDTLQIAELQTQVAGVEEKLNQLNQTALTDIKSQTEQSLAKIQLSKQQAMSEFKAIQQDIEALNVNGLKTKLAQVKNELNVLNQAVETLKVAPRQVEPKKVATKVEPKGVIHHRLKIGGYGPEMVTIPAGRFQMGSKRNSDEQPIHEVSIKTFAMSRHEITFAEYDAFAKATGRTKPSDKGWGRGHRPVINVSWHDAVAYTEWLSEQTGQQYRLPTEAEWEYAARGGTETNYWWGNEIGKNRANCDGCGSRWDNKSTSPVGSFEANPFGLYDTVGNVWEWCADNWHDNYKGAPTDGGVWKGGNESRRVLRGGSWVSFPDLCRSAFRNRYSSAYRFQPVGFRVAVAVRLQ